MLSVGLPAGTAVSYLADGQNRRVGRVLNGSLSSGYLYKDALNVVVQLDGSGNVASRFVYGTKPNVPDYFTSTAGTFRILSDHLGSPRLIVNASTGAIAEEIDYDEFGRVTNDTSPGLTPFGFAGGLYDPATGLVRFGARDYDAQTGRWTSKDPRRFQAAQINLFVYAGNDPVNHRDPSGRFSLNPYEWYEWWECYEATKAVGDVIDYCRQLTNQLCNCAPPGGKTGLGPAICGPEGDSNGNCGPTSDACLSLGVEPVMGCVQQTDPEGLAEIQKECLGSGSAGSTLWSTPVEEGTWGLLSGGE